MIDRLTGKAARSMIVALAAVLTLAVTASASAAIDLGSPSVDCVPRLFISTYITDASTLTAINTCRGSEGVGPLTLPSNWGSLNGAQQEFVLLDLERVTRGLSPVIGLVGSLDNVAMVGARRNVDPVFHGNLLWGGIWAGGDDVLGSDLGWMYADGTPNAFVTNVDCEPGNMSGCWGHRRVMLWNIRNVYGGAAIVPASGNSIGSETFVMVSNPHPRYKVIFSWARELRYFAHRPGIERAAAPKITSVSPGGIEADDSDEFVTITGRRLWDISKITVGGKAVSTLECASETSCTMLMPVLPPGSVTIAVEGGYGALHGGNTVNVTVAAEGA